MAEHASSLSEGEDLLALALDWARSGKGVAIATVVNTWGSSPRPSGSQLIVADDGHFEGSVSGGCVEGAVVLEAKGAMADGKPRLLQFGVSDQEAWDVGLACGGKIEVFVEALNAPAVRG